MPDYLKISELPVASSVAPTDQIELNQAGTSRSATIGLSVGVYQTVSYQTGALATGTTVIPADDTIPQITEGDEYMTLAITPKSATSKLIIDVTFNGAHSSTSTPCTAVALFQDSTANALAASFAQVSGGDIRFNVRFSHTMTSGSTSARTYRVRAGAHVAGTLTFNGGGGARTYGGVMASSITIQEVA